MSQEGRDLNHPTTGNVANSFRNHSKVRIIDNEECGAKYVGQFRATSDQFFKNALLESLYTMQEVQHTIVRTIIARDGERAMATKLSSCMKQLVDELISLESGQKKARSPFRLLRKRHAETTLHDILEEKTQQLQQLMEEQGMWRSEAQQLARKAWDLITELDSIWHRHRQEILNIEIHMQHMRRQMEEHQNQLEKEQLKVDDLHLCIAAGKAIIEYTKAKLEKMQMLVEVADKEKENLHNQSEEERRKVKELQCVEAGLVAVENAKAGLEQICRQLDIADKEKEKLCNQLIEEKRKVEAIQSGSDMKLTASKNTDMKLEEICRQQPVTNKEKNELCRHLEEEKGKNLQSCVEEGLSTNANREAKLDQIHKQLETTEKEKAELYSHLEEEKRKVKNLQSCIEVALATNTTTETKLEQTYKQLEATVKEKERLHNHLEEEKTKVKDLQLRIEAELATNEKNEEFKKLFHKEKEKNTCLCEEMNNLKLTVAQSFEKVTALEGHIVKLREEIERSQKEVASQETQTDVINHKRRRIPFMFMGMY
ncbi:CAP-Gly domain-containing linker protein 1-like [Protopterus annectens]|uniref:CAP-Gly domain-containing linker protein 1-like n=1 Tax=Protopterus annectens TaxID=7888 RepID=UPI001CFA854A|nr:CAP-Gly domain-containing linker protein 1-like [Protopterus annectens]